MTSDKPAQELPATAAATAVKPHTRLREMVDYLSSLGHEDLPAETAKLLKLCTLDTLGCLIGGLETEVASCVLQMVEGGSVTYRGDSTVVGTQRTVSPEVAALVNGTIAHALIFDDMHRTAKIHPGVFTVPAVFALNDCLDRSGRHVLTAIAAGYESSSRIGIAINMSEHRKMGWRATGTVGFLGAAAAAARLIGLSSEKSQHAMALAVAQASGTFAFAEGGGMELYFAAGTAARNGIVSALIAESGFQAALDPLEAEDGGLFSASSSDTDASQINASLGSAFRLGEVCIKMRPTCHSTQTAIDAALALRSKHGVRIKDISRIVVEAGEITRLQCGWEFHPASPEQMVFHMGFILASVIETGNITSADLQGPLLQHPEYVRIAKATEVRANDHFTEIYKIKKPSIVHLYLNDGRVLTERVDFCKGDPENFPTDEDVISKFRLLSTKALSTSSQDLVIDMVLTMEAQSTLKPISEILKNCRASRAG